jgi:hypothetical protein
VVQQKEKTMVRPVGNTPAPEEPHHFGLDPADPAETTGLHSVRPHPEPQPSLATATPNGGADVISALTGGPLGASSVQAASNGPKRKGAPRTITNTDIPTGAKLGTIDESDWTFKGPEKLIAQKLAQEGYNVKAVPESTIRRQRSPDALVSGNGIVNRPTEFKTPDPGAKPKTIRNEVGHSIEGMGQARNMIIDARNSGLTRDQAQEGLGLIRSRGKLDSVRVIGNEYDLTATFDKKNKK